MVTKKQKSILESVDSMTDYSLSDAVKILQEHKSPKFDESLDCLLYTSPSPRDEALSRMPSSA